MLSAAHFASPMKSVFLPCRFHAIDGDAMAFYTKFGFEQLPDQERHLFLLLKIAQDSVGTPGV